MLTFGKHVKVREEKFGAVVFDTLKEKVYITNKVGSDVLKHINGKNSVEDIVKILAEEYEADDHSIIRVDVTEFIEIGKRYGFLLDV